MMEQIETGPGRPLWFAASFPRQIRFAPAISELAVKVAQLSGCAEGEALEIGRAVESATVRAIDDLPGPDGSLDVAFQANERLFEVTVTCRGRSVLALSVPRPS